MAGPKTAVFDIERLPGTATVDHYGTTVTGPFWDLNDFKFRGVLKRRIRPEEVTRWPRTICMAWKWRGKKRIYFSAEWLNGGEERFARDVHGLFCEADVLVGHNIKSFDVKHCNWMFAQHGLPVPPEARYVDTLTIARKVWGAESKTLDSLCERLGIPRKTDKYDPAIAEAACAGDVKAQRIITSYNKGDITASEGLLERAAPWDKSFPNATLYVDEHVSPKTCPRCEEPDALQRRGFKYTSLGKFRRYQCVKCSGWTSGRQRVSGIDVRNQ